METDLPTELSIAFRRIELLEAALLKTDRLLKIIADADPGGLGNDARDIIHTALLIKET